MFLLTERDPYGLDKVVVAAPALPEVRSTPVDVSCEEFVHVASARRHRKKSSKAKAAPAPKRSVLSRVAWALVAVATVVLWAKTLAPQAIGGPAGYVMVRGVSMLPTFEPGDLIITRPQASYGKGDVVAYHVPDGDFGEGIVVIHRITGGHPRDGFVLRGDNNEELDEWEPKPKDIVGKAWLRIPKMGLVLGFLHAPVPLAALAAAITVALILVPKREPAAH